MKFFATALLCAANSAFGFELTAFQQQVPESNPIICTRVVDGSAAFSFAAPRGWLTKSDPANKRIVLYSENKAVISLQLSASPLPPNAAALKRIAETRFESPAVIEEFTAPSGGEPGLGVEVRHTANGNITMLTRLCVFKFSNGCIEASITRRPEDVQEFHAAWTSFINSLRVDRQTHVATLPRE